MSTQSVDELLGKKPESKNKSVVEKIVGELTNNGKDNIKEKIKEEFKERNEESTARKRGRPKGSKSKSKIDKKLDDKRKEIQLAIMAQTADLINVTTRTIALFMDDRKWVTTDEEKELLSGSVVNWLNTKYPDWAKDSPGFMVVYSIGMYFSSRIMTANIQPIEKNPLKGAKEKFLVRFFSWKNKKN